MLHGLAAAAPPATQNTLQSDPFSVHELVIVQDQRAEKRAFTPSPDSPGGNLKSQISGAVAAPFPFNELIASWNLVVPEGAVYRVEIRVGRADAWSAWYCFAGARPMGEQRAFEAATHDAWGTVNTDYLVLERPCERFEVRVTSAVSASGPPRPPLGKGGSEFVRIERFAVCVSNTTGDKRLWNERRIKPKRLDAARYTRRLDVPFMTQHVDDPAMVGNICSPASVAMVMAYRGVRKTPAEVARAAFDAEHSLYGNWPLNVQAAFALGVPGYVTRFATWEEVQAVIAAGQPIIASIRDPQGLLKGTPYKTTVGHLLVLCGFDANGDVLVNDPAGRDAAAGRLTYNRAQFEQAWLRRGGVAYILEPRR